jgi:hypothetical protein
MLVQDVQRYLQTHRLVSLATLCRHFQMDADALRPVLSLLMRKGRVRTLANLWGVSFLFASRLGTVRVRRTTIAITLNRALLGHLYSLRI